MNKKSIIILIVIAIAIVAVVKIVWKGDDVDSMMDAEKNAPAESMIIALNEQNASGESGSATLLGMEGKVKVIVNMTGVPAGISQPAHIHIGSCPNPADVKYPLTAVADGTSETIIDVSMTDLLAQLPLAINVHKSSDDLKTYVACGNIIASDDMMKKDDAMMDVGTEGEMTETE